MGSVMVQQPRRLTTLGWYPQLLHQLDLTQELLLLCVLGKLCESRMNSRTRDQFTNIFKFMDVSSPEM